jgi:glycosyltransferase involved in cell wall biosynthesis
MLSVIVITKNEEQHIQRCLESVSWADEIIVLDSGSQDNTLALVRAYTDKVFSTDWPGFGVQKQRALDKATGNWILSIDADEYVTLKLREQLHQAMQQSEFDGFEIPRLSSYCGREIKHGGWWPDYVLRLFKREKGKFSPELVHERAEVNGSITQLTAPLLHEAFISPEEVLYKINSYSTLSARKLHAAGKKASVSQALFKGLWTFIRTYFINAAFLDGQHGLLLAISNAEGAYYKYVKLWALQNDMTTKP